MYRSVRLASSLAAALLDDLFEHSAGDHSCSKRVATEVHGAEMVFTVGNGAGDR